MSRVCQKGGKIEAQQSPSGYNPALTAVESHGIPAVPSQAREPSAGGLYSRFAQVVSGVGSPPVVASAAILVTALRGTSAHTASAQAVLWAVGQVALSVLAPFWYVVWLVKRGDITDVDVRLRKQRIGPLLVTVACTGVAWMGLWMGGAPRGLIWVAGGMWLQGLMILGITSRWKISVHTATAAAATTWSSLLLQTPLPALLVVPLVAWSRVWLRRHTVLQTVAGAALGFILFLALWHLGGGG